MYTMGIDPTQVTDTPVFAPGAIAFNITPKGDSKGYILLRNVSTQTATDGQVFTFNGTSYNSSFLSTSGSAPGAGQGRMIAIPRATIPNTLYGWYQIYGQGLIRVKALAAANTQLNTTATGAVLDDDATAGARVAEGVVLGITNGAAEGTVLGFLNWPYVGRTL